mmetsp:Transcript_28315/g.37796  ORF Transcript_28315/g.37796 Transcript_28315/m.37796 type:complete len:112 (+) Transcript_28315:1064-1399(+)
MRASETIKHVELVQMEICKFVQPHFVGQLLELQAKVIYVDQKKGLAYVQVESKSVDLINAKQRERFVGDEKNILNLTYKIDKKKIRAKQIMPSSYDESLLYLQGKRTIDAM